MPKFFVSPNNILQHTIKIESEDAKHINVLRMKKGDSILLCDSHGIDYNCKITNIEKDEVMAEIIESYPCQSEPKINVTIFQGLPKSDKMELIIQKTVELGVFDIVPVVTTFSVAKPSDNIDKKIARWQKISESAAVQSERGIIPVVHEPLTFKNAVEKSKSLDKTFVAYEREKNSMATKLFDSQNETFKRVGIFIGPEGGFSKDEVEYCLQNEIKPFSLGKRILRTETAGFVSLLLLLFSNDEF